MSSDIAESHARAGARNLRLRAESRLKKELAINKKSQLHEVGLKLYEQRINQIEIELLSREFNQLKNKKSLNAHAEKIKFGYFFLDREGRVCDAKLSFNKSTPADACKWRGRPLDDFVQADMRGVFQQFLQTVFESDSKKTCELTFSNWYGNKRSGLKLPQYASLEAVADEDKNYCIAVFEDISTRKITEIKEKASREALALLENTIAASRNEILMVDVATNHFTFANKCALENLGYTLDELRALTPAKIRSEVDDKKIIDLISHEQREAKFKAMHQRKNGTMYPVEVYLQRVDQESGSYFITIAQDISSQIAIESQLKSIVESSSAIIWAADVNFRLIFISEQMLNILGHNASQLVGHTLLELIDAGIFHDSDKEALTEGFYRVIKDGGKISDLRHRAKHADGTWRWISLNMMPSIATDGEVDQIVGVMHDIHAQKMAEDALLNLNRELDSLVKKEIQKNIEKDLMLQRQDKLAGMGEMIGNIAHQWRQPINSLGLIMSDLEDAALYGECDLAYIRTAVGKSKKIIQKMSSTIDDFRNFFRMDKSIGTFGLRQVTDECLNLVEAAMKGSNIDIIVKCESDVFVSGYANEYSQAVMNILSNARDAIVEKKLAAGKIIIEIGQDGGFGVHSITDNGGGIAPELLTKIFDPHFTTKENGVGIGLYMTLISIEKNMKGKILVENVGDGARFSIYLPKTESGGAHAIH